MDTNYIIETKNLTKQYGSQKSVADLNIHVKRGRIYGLLGRNGAGKTTTMKMLLGLTKPTSGEVKIWGKSLQGNEKKLLPRIGSLIESPGFYPNLTATEICVFLLLYGECRTAMQSRTLWIWSGFLTRIKAVFAILSWYEAAVGDRPCRYARSGTFDFG